MSRVGMCKGLKGIEMTSHSSCQFLYKRLGSADLGPRDVAWERLNKIEVPYVEQNTDCQGYLKSTVGIELPKF